MKLSQSDRNFYEKIQTELGKSFVSKVDVAIDRYKERMNMLRWTEEKKLESHKQII